ncbi:MAG: DUF2059 domain-containing protein, partial [Rhodobacterales bacterium]
TDQMYDTVRDGVAQSLGDQDLTPLLDYLGTEEGKRVVALEIDARQALVEPAAEDVARSTFRDLDGTGNPRLAQLDRLVDANDLVEANVTGALNASYNFYTGLAEGGALEMSEDEILSDVWDQEEETRQDTREWLYGYMLLAYGPLSNEALGEYIDISSSEAGQAMNRALFTGFNTMYDNISRQLGLAAAGQMQAQDL